MGTRESLLAAHLGLGFKQNRVLSQDLTEIQKNVANLPGRHFASKRSCLFGVSSFICWHHSVGG